MDRVADAFSDRLLGMLLRRCLVHVGGQIVQVGTRIRGVALNGGPKQ